jgi:hypothetical protein
LRVLFSVAGVRAVFFPVRLFLWSLEMRFDDNNDDEFWNEKRELNEEAKAFFANYDRAADFAPKETLLLYGCEVTATDIQLANVFLSRFKKLESACNVLRAASALRNVIGLGTSTADESTKRWNDVFHIGQQVQYWPDGRNGETYLSRTSSPAFDTPCGPCILVEDHETAVALCNVEPRKIKSPEVAA